MSVTNGLVQIVCNATLQRYGGEYLRWDYDSDQLGAGNCDNAGDRTDGGIAACDWI